jgi:hypothetical protein
MTITDWTKLSTVLVVSAGAVFLAHSGSISSDSAVALLGAAMGYVFGNGHGIMESKKVVK